MSIIYNIQLRFFIIFIIYEISSDFDFCRNKTRFEPSAKANCRDQLIVLSIHTKCNFRSGYEPLFARNANENNTQSLQLFANSN